MIERMIDGLLELKSSLATNENLEKSIERIREEDCERCLMRERERENTHAHTRQGDCKRREEEGEILRIRT